MARRNFQERCLATPKAPAGHIHLTFCLNYVGTAFRGLQIQTAGPTHQTVEGVLLQALRDVGLITALERGRPHGNAHHLARSCRTDRGVHAIRNVVSLFVLRDRFDAAGGCDGIRAKVNAVLVPAVRVAKVSVVLDNFIPRNCCNRRVYRYLIPAYALLPPADGWGTLARYYPGWESGISALATHLTAEAQAQTREATRPLSLLLADGDALPASLAAQVGPLLLALTNTTDKCNNVVSAHYVGFHRFHNFCVDAEPPAGQPRMSSRVIAADNEEAGRVIYRCEILPRVYLLPCDEDSAEGVSLKEFRDNATTAPEDPAPPNDTSRGAGQAPGTTHLPFLLFQVEGGSFLFNMIRKMVGTLLAVCRGASEHLLSEALSPTRTVTTPLAPGAYLYLALSTYHGYDTAVQNRNTARERRRQQQQQQRRCEEASSLPEASATPSDGGRGETTIRPLREEWAGAVAEDCERFAWQVIARDIVDVDLHRVPTLDEMLAARDRAARVTRPQWVEEDAHLSEMKEYTPSEETVRRNRALAKPTTAASTAVTSPAAPPSEMTRFLRMLRVHNWCVKTVHLPPDSKAMLEEKNRRAKQETNAATSATTTAVDTQPAASSAPTDESTSRVSAVPEGGEDGWVYAGSTPAEEQALRQAYFTARWKRSRPWEHDGGEGTAQRDRVSGAHGEPQVSNGDEDGSCARSE